MSTRRTWMVQIDGQIPSSWDATHAGREELLAAASSIGGGRGSLEVDDDARTFRFVLVLPGGARRPDDIARLSREGLQEAITVLELVGTSVVWRTFDVLPDD